MAGNDDDSEKAALLARLRRVEGQIRGIEGMIEREAECEQVAQQLAAARSALDRAFHEMIGCAMKRELQNFTGDAGAAQQCVAQYTRLLLKYA